jgi:microcystin-dependent protein
MPQIHPVLPADGDDAIVEPYNAALNLILGVINGSIDVDNLADGAVTLAKLSAAVQASLMPAGAIIAFGSLTPPTGFLVCDGTSYLRATYPTLFAVLGTSYGSADGTHFNVPDLRGRVPVGADALGGTAANRIQRTNTLTTTSGSPTATVGSATGLSIGMVVTNANVAAGTTITAISGTTLTLSANATGSGTTIAATFSLIGNAAVVGSSGGVDVHQLVVAQLANHFHNSDSQLIKYVTTGGQFTIPGGGAENTGAAATTTTGGDQPHPNVQPSLTASYIIKT